MTAILLMAVPAPAVTLCAVADWAVFRLYQDNIHPWVGLLKEVRQFGSEYVTIDFSPETCCREQLAETVSQRHRKNNQIICWYCIS